MTDEDDEKPAQQVIVYRHKNGNAWFKQAAKDPIPDWAVDVQPAQQQEPVATDWERIARVQDAKLRAMCDEPGGFEKLCEVMDRYERTSPPAQRKPLTDEKIGAVAADIWGSVLIAPQSYQAFARAIEAKLKEKNNG